MYTPMSVPTHFRPYATEGAVFGSLFRAYVATRVAAGTYPTPPAPPPSPTAAPEGQRRRRGSSCGGGDDATRESYITPAHLKAKVYEDWFSLVNADKEDAGKENSSPPAQADGHSNSHPHPLLLDVMEPLDLDNDVLPPMLYRKLTAEEQEAREKIQEAHAADAAASKEIRKREERQIARDKAEADKKKKESDFDATEALYKRVVERLRSL